MEFQVPAASGASSTEQDMVIPAPSLRSEGGIPPLFNHGDFGDIPANEGGRWFFNMKVHHPPAHNYPPSQPSQPVKKPTTSLDALPPATPRPAKPPKTKASRRQTREQSKAASRDQGRDSGGVGNTGKLGLIRQRKLQALPSPAPSPAELREQIDIQTARSIGDSVIFHNIPERYEDTPEAEVVNFCQDYFVGRRIKHVNFGQVHKMEQRFGKEPPIAARFTLALAPQADQSEEGEKKYQPQPYIPPVPRRKLPILKGKNRRKTQYSVDT